MLLPPLILFLTDVALSQWTNISNTHGSSSIESYLEGLSSSIDDSSAEPRASSFQSFLFPTTTSADELIIPPTYPSFTSQIPATITGSARDDLLFSLAYTYGLYSGLVDTNNSQIPETGSGFAYALTCANLFSSWTSKSRAMSALSNFGATTIGQITEVRTITVTNYTYSEVTSLCDGQARVESASPIATWIYTSSVTSDVVKRPLLDRLHSLKPKCHIDQPDCGDILYVDPWGASLSMDIPGCRVCTKKCRIFVGSIDFLFAPVTTITAPRTCQTVNDDRGIGWNDLGVYDIIPGSIDDKMDKRADVLVKDSRLPLARFRPQALVPLSDLTNSSIDVRLNHNDSEVVYGTWRGQSFDLGFAYAEVQTAYAVDFCGQRIGGSYPRTILTLNSSEIVTVRTGYLTTWPDESIHPALVVMRTETMQFDDFYPPVPYNAWRGAKGYDWVRPKKDFCDARQGTICERIYVGPKDTTVIPEIYEDEYHPNMIAPNILRALDPAWANCRVELYGYDPPQILQVVTSLRPDASLKTVPLPGATASAGRPQQTPSSQSSPLITSTVKQSAGISNAGLNNYGFPRQPEPAPTGQPMPPRPSEDSVRLVTLGSYTLSMLRPSQGLLLPNGETLSPGGTTAIGDIRISLDPVRGTAVVVTGGKTTFVHVSDTSQDPQALEEAGSRSYLDPLPISTQDQKGSASEKDGVAAEASSANGTQVGVASTVNGGSKAADTPSKAQSGAGSVNLVRYELWFMICIVILFVLLL